MWSILQAVEDDKDSGEGIILLPMLSHSILGRRCGQLSYSCAYKSRSPSGSPTGSALVCCPGKVPCLHCHVLQMVRAWVSSPTLMVLGPALSPATNDKVLGEWRASFFLPCLHRADQGAGYAFLLSFPMDQLTCAPANSVNSIVLPRVDSGSALPNAYALPKQMPVEDSANSPALIPQGQLTNLPQVARVEEVWTSSLSCPLHRMAEERWGQICTPHLCCRNMASCPD